MTDVDGEFLKALRCQSCEGEFGGHRPSCPNFRTFEERGLLPVSDPSETLALIAEHRLRLTPSRVEPGTWIADQPYAVLTVIGDGHTIGDAVRACVQRIREGK